MMHFAKKLAVCGLFWANFGMAKPSHEPKWNLVWADEFETEGPLDAGRWQCETGRGRNGWGNQEKQYYTARRENVRVQGGRLIIEVRREAYEGAGYTSARIKTLGSGDWLRGRFEVRAKLPGGRGMWPAIWLMPSRSAYGHWPRSGEIDLMEYVGHDPTRVFGTVHTQSFNHTKNTQRPGYFAIRDASDEFHVYGLEWSEDEIVWMVDGQPYHRFAREEDFTANEWPFDQEFYLILNIAVGGGLGGKMGIDDRSLPQRMEVDYVRVYQRPKTDPTGR